MNDVIQKANELSELVADEGWVGSEQATDQIRGHLMDLDFLILGLPLRPKDGVLTLEYRMARAEAERTRGSCIVFEKNAGLSSSAKMTTEETKSLGCAGDQLFVALSVFLAMAEGL